MKGPSYGDCFLMGAYITHAGFVLNYSIRCSAWLQKDVYNASSSRGHQLEGAGDDITVDTMKIIISGTVAGNL